MQTAISPEAVRQHRVNAQSSPQVSPFDATLRPDTEATAVLESGPSHLHAQPSPASARSAAATLTLAAAQQGDNAVQAAAACGEPSVHGLQSRDDPPQPSTSANGCESALVADPLRLESLELKLSAAAAQRRPRTLRPRRPRTPEIADSAQLGAEQVRGWGYFWSRCGVNLRVRVRFRVRVCLGRIFERFSRTACD